MDTPRSFTGRRRQRTTRWTVRVGEVLARGLITVGGIGTIIAVSLVCFYLAWVVFPLFLSAKASDGRQLETAWNTDRPIHMEVDEYQLLGWALYPDGKLILFRLDNGKLLQRRDLATEFFAGQTPTAFSPPDRRESQVAFGFADGKTRLGRLTFAPDTLASKDVPQALHELAVDEVAEHDGGVVQRTGLDQWRTQKLIVEVTAPFEGASASAVERLSHRKRQREILLASATADGKLFLSTVDEKQKNPLAKKTYELRGHQELPHTRRPEHGNPTYLLISGLGDNVFAAWSDGRLVRFPLAYVHSPETVDLLDRPGLTLTALRWLIGETTLLAGDSSGRVRAWFRAAASGATAGDGGVLNAAHPFTGPQAAVTALSASTRSRMTAAGYADGSVRVFFVTTDRLLTAIQTEQGQPIQSLTFAPKDDGLVALTPTGIWRWRYDPGHPEVTLSTLFLRPVWYEGYEKPTYTWQSSSSDDAFEPKLSLRPLVFGTLKATFYSLLMGVPLALLAAIYTSEFLHPRLKSVVKPTIELMASLPSVVLGFLAALVFAPFVARVLPSVLCAFLTVPVAFVLGAFLFQLLPEKRTLHLARWQFLFIFAALPIGLVAAGLLGPVLDRLLFAGDLKGWLNGNFGTGFSGWVVLLFPLGVAAVALLFGATVNPWLRRQSATWGRTRSAAADLVKFLAGAGLAVCLACVLALVLNALGFDPRGSVLGRYDNRNALIVGLVMGFAIIPIIYTIAEDALSSVPQHLRSASLGCGATPWQTAVRIIIPTAMSGIFSAVMIGLGRAVGETMIVLMATGSTPLMDWNIFNGFRTLSASIAIELPEAAPNSTHYRTLFLAALTLFIITFVLNTVAEVVRQRFRRRAYQL